MKRLALIALLALAALATWAHDTNDGLRLHGSRIRNIYIQESPGQKPMLCIMDGARQVLEPTTDGSTLYDLELECFDVHGETARGLATEGRSREDQ